MARTVNKAELVDVVAQKADLTKVAAKEALEALLETMPMSEDIRRIVVSGGSSIDLRDQALKEGMITLRRVGLNNALKGNTSMQEVLDITRLDK